MASTGRENRETEKNQIRISIVSRKSDRIYSYLILGSIATQPWIDIVAFCALQLVVAQ